MAPNALAGSSRMAELLLIDAVRPFAELSEALDAEDR
jgi:hypothetical protein